MAEKILGLWTAAGGGTRTRPLTLLSPTSFQTKGHLRLRGQPIANTQLKQMQDSGLIEHLHIVAKDRDNRLQLGDRFQDGRIYDSDGKN